jgi:hypothetical protein
MISIECIENGIQTVSGSGEQRAAEESADSSQKTQLKAAVLREHGNKKIGE